MIKVLSQHNTNKPRSSSTEQYKISKYVLCKAYSVKTCSVIKVHVKISQYIWGYHRVPLEISGVIKNKAQSIRY